MYRSRYSAYAHSLYIIHMYIYVQVKSRYSAYAYSLPEYIMATTNKKSPEWQADEKVAEKVLKRH